jgi:hypothetical protein
MQIFLNSENQFLGPKSTLNFMKWLGLNVITEEVDFTKNLPLLKFIETEVFFKNLKKTLQTS